MIANNDAENKSGTHWWSFLDIEKKDSMFLFQSFGTLGLLNFIVQNDNLIFNKVIKGMKNIFMKDNKISMLKRTFQRNKYLKLTQKGLNQLSDTAFYSFRFLDEFSKSKDIKNNVYVYTVDDPIQSMETDYCRPFLLYFYLNLFTPLE